jgi:LmbE family N-acetylglucosaminyl deacetylase
MAKKWYRAVIISPHLDDAVFSCGGVIAQLVKEGPVLVLNLFTQYPAELKIHGAVLGAERYQEEKDAARVLGFESLNLGELDAPFRRDAYKKLGNLFMPPVIQDLEWLPTLRDKVFSILAELTYDQLFVPLGIGWHVDHVLSYLLFEPWAGQPNMLFYEDSPYCNIPHSTRYRLNELATYPRTLTDISLAPSNALHAWWQAAMAYADTALMKNLSPWIVKWFAVPVVSIYLFRLMAIHRRLAIEVEKRRMEPVEMSIPNDFAAKVAVMALYKSQFTEFFASDKECAETLQHYARRRQGENGCIERFWVTAG